MCPSSSFFLFPSLCHLFIPLQNISLLPNLLATWTEPPPAFWFVPQWSIMTMKSHEGVREIRKWGWERLEKTMQHLGKNIAYRPEESIRKDRPFICQFVLYTHPTLCPGGIIIFCKSLYCFKLHAIARDPLPICLRYSFLPPCPSFLGSNNLVNLQLILLEI